MFMKAAPENLRKAMSQEEAETMRKISCLVTDGFLWFAAEIAEEMKVPFVPCWLSGSVSLTAHIYTDLIRETVGVEGMDSRLIIYIVFSSGFNSELIWCRTALIFCVQSILSAQHVKQQNKCYILRFTT